MTVRRAIENKAFFGKRVFRRSSYPRIQALKGSDGTCTQAGVLTWCSATGGCFIAVDTAGTGTKINV